MNSDSPPKEPFSFTFIAKRRRLSNKDANELLAGNVAQLQILQYLTDKREGPKCSVHIKLLKKSIGSTTSCYAPVSLWSDCFHEMIQTVRRNRLSSKNLENLILFKSNRKL